MSRESQSAHAATFHARFPKKARPSGSSVGPLRGVDVDLVSDFEDEFDQKIQLVIEIDLHEQNQLLSGAIKPSSFSSSVDDRKPAAIAGDPTATKRKHESISGLLHCDSAVVKRTSSNHLTDGDEVDDSSLARLEAVKRSSSSAARTGGGKAQKYNIMKYYAKKATVIKVDHSRPNPGTGRFTAAPEKLDELKEIRWLFMSSIQKLGWFGLRHIHRFARRNVMRKMRKQLCLVRHHGLPVNDQCDGTDAEENRYDITYAIHYVWHLCMFVLFKGSHHATTVKGFLKGLMKGLSKFTIGDAVSTLVNEIQDMVPKLLQLDPPVVIPAEVVEILRNSKTTTTALISDALEEACDESNAAASICMTKKWELGLMTATPNSEACKKAMSKSRLAYYQNDTNPIGKNHPQADHIGDKNANFKHHFSKADEVTLINAVHEYHEGQQRISWRNILQTKFPRKKFDISKLKRFNNHGTYQTDEQLYASILTKIYEKLCQTLRIKTPHTRLEELAQTCDRCASSKRSTDFNKRSAAQRKHRRNKNDLATK